MLPVCSATTCSSCHTKVLIPGGLKPLSPYSKTFDVNCNNINKIVLSFSNGAHPHKPSSPTRPVSCSYSNQTGNIEKYVSDESLSFISENAEPNSVSPFDGLLVDPPILPELLNIDENSLPGQEKNVADIISEVNKSTADIITGGKNALNSLFDNVTSSVTNTLTHVNEAVDNAVNEIFSFFNKSGESAGNKLTGLSGELMGASGKTGLIALDFLRKTIVVVEDSLVEGSKDVGYVYSSAKNFLPLEIQESLNLTEKSVTKVLNPAGTAFRQVYMAVEGFEERLGLDPNDPLIPFFLFFGLSVTL